MKKAITIFGTVIICILHFTSCTIDKRLYSSGYHIEWKTSPHNLVKNEKRNNNNRKQTEIYNSVIIEQSETTSKIVHHSTEPFDQNLIASVNNESIILSKKKLNNLATIQNSDFYSQKTIINSSNKSDLKKRNKTLAESSNEEPIINTFGLISFICGLAIFLTLGIPSLLLGSIAYRQFKRNPEKYKDKWMATVGVVMGYIGCAFGILFSLAAVIFGEPIYLIIGVVCLINIIVCTILLNI